MVKCPGRAKTQFPPPHHLLKRGFGSGNALVSVDQNATAEGAPTPSNGFNQTTAPATAPPVPTAVEAGAVNFHQVASSFGRKLQSQDTGLQENASKARLPQIRLPFDHSNMVSASSVMAQEANALKQAVAAANKVSHHCVSKQLCDEHDSPLPVEVHPLNRKCGYQGASYFNVR